MPQFTLYQSDSLEQLAKAFTLSTTTERTNPLAPRTILTQNPGMETWLTQQIALQQTVFAAVKFVQPTDYLMSLYATITGSSEQKTVFEPKKMRWFIYEEIFKNVDDEQYGPIADYLGDEKGEIAEQKLYAFANTMAELFDSYILYRPEMLMAWEEGKAHAFKRGELSEQEKMHEQWQSVLWQKICEHHRERIEDNLTKDVQSREKIGENPVRAIQKLGEILAGDSEELAQWKNRPSVVQLFSISLLPPKYTHIFKLISRHIDVELYVTNPSRYYWGDVWTDNQIAWQKKIWQNKKSGVHAKHHIDQGNSLLRNLGASGRDFFYGLYDCAEELQPHEYEYDNDNELRTVEPSSLLSHIQDDILNWSEENRLEKPVLDLGASTQKDTSLSINRCFSPLREVEVLHDFLSQCFKEDDTLTLGDILVITPELETYAPIIDQQFPRFGQKLTGTIADRSALAESSFLQLLKEILLTPTTNYTATHIVSLFENYMRFMGDELTITEIKNVQKWVAESGIRWGVDGSFWQSRIGGNDGAQLQPEFGHNLFSWKSGIDKMLKGYALGQTDLDHSFDSSIYSAIEGGDTTLLGELSLFFKNLLALEKISKESHPIMYWEKELIAWCKTVLKDATEDHEDSTISELSTIIKAIQALSKEFEISGVDESDCTFRYSTIRTALLSTLEDATTGSRFLAGAITFASTIPLRSIPFKIIATIGMDYSSFPRTGNRVSFDLMSAQKQRGDRSVRENDLYLFLETIMAAQKKLYISYVAFGNSVGDEIPASSVVEQLSAYCDEQYILKQPATADSSLKKISESISLTHPLHPFSSKYVTVQGQNEGCYTYNKMWFSNTPQEAVSQESLIGMTLTKSATTVNSRQLLAYLSDPLKDMYENLFELSFVDNEEVLEDEELFGIDKLQQWQLRDAGILGIFEKRDVLEEQIEKMTAGGRFPVGAAREYTKVQQQKDIESLEERMDEELIQVKESVICRVSGEVVGCRYELETAPVRFVGDRAHVVDAGKLELTFNKKAQTYTALKKTKRYFSLLLTHLILNCEKAYTTQLICLDTTVFFDPLSQEEARRELEVLVSLYKSSREQVLPYFGKQSINAYLSLGEVSNKVALSNLFEADLDAYGPGTTNFYEALFWSRYGEGLTDEQANDGAEITATVLSLLSQLNRG